MIVNRELTQEIRIERHREGNAPIVFEFVDSAGDPYAVTGTYVFYIGRRTLPGVIAGNLLTFELLPADKAALPQGVYPFEIAYLDGANEPIPFKGVFSWAVLSGNQSSNTVPRIRVTVGPTSYTAGVSVIAGPKGDTGEVGAGLKLSYRHVQMSASNTWTVAHNMGYRPGGVDARDSSGAQWIGSITHLDENNFEINYGEFSFSGELYCS